MDFREATDAVSKAVTHEELAARLGVHVQRVRQARLDPDADGYRPPPQGWRLALAGLVQERGMELLELAPLIADGG